LIVNLSSWIRTRLFCGILDINLTNQVYNLADFVNKILINMIVYAAAKIDTK
jgi:hypothetical protein